jgi:hypothetical protein
MVGFSAVFYADENWRFSREKHGFFFSKLAVLMKKSASFLQESWHIK